MTGKHEPACRISALLAPSEMLANTRGGLFLCPASPLRDPLCRACSAVSQSPSRLPFPFCTLPSEGISLITVGGDLNCRRRGIPGNPRITLGGGSRIWALPSEGISSWESPHYPRRGIPDLGITVGGDLLRHYRRRGSLTISGHYRRRGSHYRRGSQQVTLGLGLDRRGSPPGNPRITLGGGSRIWALPSEGISSGITVGGDLLPGFLGITGRRGSLTGGDLSRLPSVWVWGLGFGIEQRDLPSLSR